MEVASRISTIDRCVATYASDDADAADAAPVRMETRNTARASTCVDCEALRHVTTQRDGVSETRGLG